MPRHTSVSAAALMEYQYSLLHQVLEARRQPANNRNYCDVGRLADLVSEISLLRDEVDELTLETQCQKHGLLPHLSLAVKKSRPGTPVTSRAGWESRTNTYYEEDGDEQSLHRTSSDQRGDTSGLRIMFGDDVAGGRGGTWSNAGGTSDSEETMVGSAENENEVRRADDMV